MALVESPKKRRKYLACGTHAMVFDNGNGTVLKAFNETGPYEHERAIFEKLNGSCFPEVQEYHDSTKSIVMERFNMELFRLVERHAGKFTEVQARAIIKRMVKAVAALHELGIAHLDIKLENFLVDLDPLRVVLADFDAATVDERTNAILGTVNFMAPEVLECYFEDRVDYDTKKSDMWSLALAIFIVLVGYPPVLGATIHHVEVMKVKLSACTLYYWILNEDWRSFWEYLQVENISKDSKFFLQRLLCPNPDKRMTAAELLTHPWLAGLESTSF
jgi:serine/threonine protein kinase